MTVGASDSVSTTDRPPGVAVVGAGLSGLACARLLVDHGHAVRVFEKARGVGGRMSTRRDDERRFDHGAQYFTVRDERFQRWVDSWRHEGTVSLWHGRIAVLASEGLRPKEEDTERFVGVPGMNAICRHLAVDLDVTLETRVKRLERLDDRWRLLADDEAELGRFDTVVVSAPAAQTAELLQRAAPEMAAQAAQVEMAPCWAAMASFPQPVGVDFDGAFVGASPLSWVARNSSKPGRPVGEAWLLHGSPDWSRGHIDLEKEDAALRLLDAFRVALGGLAPEPSHLVAHRWRYALPVDPLPETCLYDAELRLGACGDWCGGPRVEGAFLSGCAVAGQLLAQETSGRPGGAW